MSGLRKVHRFGFSRQGAKSSSFRMRPSVGSTRLATRAACGVMLYPGTPNCGYAVVDEVFLSFPTEQRCWTCEGKWTHLTGSRKGAIELVATVETIVLAFDRIGQAARDYPHESRGCYFEIDHAMAGGRRQQPDPRCVCYCGRNSWLDWPSQQIMATDARDAIIAHLNRKARAETFEGVLEWTS